MKKKQDLQALACKHYLERNGKAVNPSFTPFFRVPNFTQSDKRGKVVCMLLVLQSLFRIAWRMDSGWANLLLLLLPWEAITHNLTSCRQAFFRHGVQYIKIQLINLLFFMQMFLVNSRQSEVLLLWQWLNFCNLLWKISLKNLVSP